MEAVTTKTRILHVALDLFAKDGYTAVSIRDICAQVGIKESTVYYHFKNKRAIFDELFQTFQRTAQGMMDLLDHEMNGVDKIEDSAFQMVCDVFFEKYLMDDFCNRFIRLISLEQLNNAEVQALYTKWMFDEPLRFQSRIFSRMIGAGILPSVNSDYTAIKYYAPIYLYTQRYLLSGELTEQKKADFRSEANRHIVNFFKECGVH